MPLIEILTGARFGRLVCISDEIQMHSGQRSVRCRCDCGTERLFNIYSLNKGTTKSCGCYKRDKAAAAKRTHGMRHSREYNTWRGMRERCTNSLHKDYHSYGGKGVKVSPRWVDSFETFISDMGRCPAGLTLDRIDSNGDYTPENCRWADSTTQTANRSVNIMVTIDGETLPISVWARKFGLKRQSVLKRYHASGDAMFALELAPNPNHRIRKSARIEN